MNYEDQDIPEYYRRKEKEHEELCDAGAIVLAALIACAIILFVAQAVYKCLGG